MSVYAIGSAAVGVVFLSRVYCVLSRCLGAGLVALSFVLLASPAWADQTVMAADGSQVDCAASAKDLTRISLVCQTAFKRDPRSASKRDPLFR